MVLKMKMIQDLEKIKNIRVKSSYIEGRPVRLPVFFAYWTTFDPVNGPVNNSVNGPVIKRNNLI